jgi:beta-phosphoglucomutase
MLREKPQAVIFDMDGVIVDSMPYHFIAWYEALRPEGLRVSCFDVYTKEGEKWDKTLKALLKAAGINPTRQKLRQVFLRRQKLFRKYFKRFIFSGAEDFLGCLKTKGYRLGLVTGTPREELNHILPARIKCLFEKLVTGDCVKRGKPHPEPYLTAARMLGMSPAQCVVIENAPLGIASAKKAGMYCIALTTSLPPTYLKKADRIVNSFSEITEIIDRKCSGK